MAEENKGPALSNAEGPVLSNAEGWFQKDKPLWLPEGSIRAMVTLMLIGTVCALCLANVTHDLDKDRFHTSLAVLEGLAGAAFGYYFNQKNGKQPKKDMSAPRLPASRGRGAIGPTDE